MKDAITLTKEDAEKYGSMTLGAVEQWAPTMSLRYVEREIPVDDIYSRIQMVLQQAHIETFSSRVEWRDIEIAS